MGAPATTGQLRDDISHMAVGDYIYGYYDSNEGWGIGQMKGSEIPFTGLSNLSVGGYFYYIKVGKGLLISDRVVQNSVSWQNLNSNGLIEGRSKTLGGLHGRLRSIRGGCAYSDEYGRSSLQFRGVGGWPTNEWDRHIASFPFELIRSDATLEDVFHYSVIATWCQDTPVMGFYPGHSSSVSSSDWRIIRPFWESSPSSHKTVKGSTRAAADTSYSSVGFRPIFEYKEV